MVKKYIKIQYDKILGISQELLNTLNKKNQFKITVGYEPKDIRVGDFYDTYLYVTHFIKNGRKTTTFKSVDIRPGILLNTLNS